MFLDLVELSFAVVIILGALTQIIGPLFQGKKVFPMFRKGREDILEAELREAREEIERARLQKEVQHAREEALRQQLRNQAELERLSRDALSGRLADEVAGTEPAVENVRPNADKTANQKQKEKQ